MSVGEPPSTAIAAIARAKEAFGRLTDDQMLAILESVGDAEGKAAIITLVDALGAVETASIEGEKGKAK